MCTSSFRTDTGTYITHTYIPWYTSSDDTPGTCGLIVGAAVVAPQQWSLNAGGR